MEQLQRELDGLEAKQRKLIFMFGEKLFELARTEDVRFRYSFGGAAHQKEVEKLLSYLNYMEDRIEKIDEQLSAEGDAVAADDEIAEDDAVEVAGAAIEKAAEDDVEAVVEEVVEEEVREELPPPQPEPVTMIEAVAAPALKKAVVKEASSVILTPVEAGEDVIIKVDHYEEDQINRVVDEEVSIEEAVAVPFSPTRDPLEDILNSEDFMSEADRRIFENNLKLLKSTEEREREIGIGQIAHLSTKNALRRAYGILLKDPSIRIRLAVIKSVTRMKDADALGYFDLGLSDPDQKVRIAALKGLGTHVSDKNGAVLQKLLQDKDEHIRALAVTYLGIYYGKEGVVKAIAAKADTSPYVRISLIELLSIVKPDGALRIVKELLSDKDESVKKAAEKALDKVMPERKKDSKHGHKKN